METSITVSDIAIRLILTLIAGGVLGLNRIERDRPAGLRTILLVTLAASVGMIETNILLNSNGKPHDSFVTMDIMRIPLGLLDGIGFIGAGTILRRGSLVVGVTTAATLWIATMVGICLGGGQLGLGSTATLLGAGILWCLRWVERYIRQHRHASLTFAVERDGIEEEIRSTIARSGYTIAPQSVSYISAPRRKKLSWDIGWISTVGEQDPPDFLSEIASQEGVTELEWKEIHAQQA